MAKAISAEQFLETLRASKLLRRRELDAFLSRLTPEERRAAPGLAAALLRQGLISPFQARKLLAGISRGLALGPYRVLAPLGRGGMGKVYLARDGRTGRPVALKVLPPHWAREHEKLLVRFRREMEISSHLEHPNVAHAYETGIDGDVHFIVLEYVPGETIYQRVSRRGPLPPDTAARVFAEAADALAHAHERGLVHRDVKPSNIMLTPAGHAKVLDLGLALRPGEDGEATVIGGQGIVVGTMEYISPEQSRNAAGVDGRADIYSLGATMFFALTGRSPFPGGTAKDKILRHRKEEPPRVDEYNLDVPEGMSDLVGELLEKDAADRPQTAMEVAERLREWAAPPVPPDSPADVQRILASLDTDPDAADTSAPSELPAKPWPTYLLVSGAAALVLALAALVVALLTR